MNETSVTRVIGIDAGTNSLGWAIVDRKGNGEYELVDKGVNIFQEGVKIEKGVESSRAAERTKFRSQRKHYWRRKIRKIELLRLLSEYGLCPCLSSEELKDWRKNDQYPVQNKAFMQWQSTNEATDYQPYALRHLCVHTALDMSAEKNRWLVGRALYHIAQRRGFLSNRKDQSDDESGKVKESIGNLNEKMQEAGCEYLCDYFYSLYHQGERIRAHYTDRVEHYEKEFARICELQKIDGEKRQKLHHAIFYQRPLKSQKQSVGKCPFEPSKTRAAVGHPCYEDFRCWTFIRNIKIQTPVDETLRPLNGEEIAKINHLFYRKSKPSFAFEDIAKALAPKKQYGYYKDAEKKPFLFNYHMDQSVSGCPVNTALMDVFGEEQFLHLEDIEKQQGNGFRTKHDILTDLWQALAFYDDEDKLAEWGKTHYDMTDEQAAKFAQIHLPQGYASLSLKPMELMTRLMEEMELSYAYACLLAKVFDYLHEDINILKDEVLPMFKATYLKEFTSDGELIDRAARELNFHQALQSAYGFSDKQISKLYHPSMIETYPQAKPREDNKVILGSPRISAVKNPMAMHSLFRLRKVLNELLQEGTIDRKTIVHIEFARELNDANRRKAIQNYQRDLEKKRQEVVKKIQEAGIANPTDTDIQKYLLWEEQDGICLYTGKTIGLADLFNGTKFDIEHTVPRSMGGDSTRTNLTICDSKFNREVKKAQLPIALSNHDAILERVAPWQKKVEDLDKLIRKINTRGLATKDAKDRVLVKKHSLELERDYWRNKVRTFSLEEKDVEGFARRQGTDISVINKYAKMYLQSVFDRVDVVKGTMTAEFRKQWGLQDEDEKKSRDNHAHHCVDAITIACIGRGEYNELSAFFRQDELHRYYGSYKPQFSKPWPTFTEDVKAIKDELIIAHYTADNMRKHTRKKLRDRNGILRDRNGKALITEGDTARGALHMETLYGAIQHKGELRYVQRVMIESLTDPSTIVDDAVKAKIKAAIDKYGSIAKALEAGPIWMNEDKQIPIRHVRVLTGEKNPLDIRKHRDVSKHEYKQMYHAKVDGNYAMAIYRGLNSKGKICTTIEAINMFAAAKFLRRSAEGIELIPQEKNGFPLAMVLKTGTVVMFYENDPEEVWNLPKKEQVKRLYKVSVIKADSRITFTHLQEARPAKETEREVVSGAYSDVNTYVAKRRISASAIFCLVEGQDFRLTETGKIEKIC